MQIQNKILVVFALDSQIIKRVVHRATEGEVIVQQEQGSTDRAKRFYDNHMKYEIDNKTRDFIRAQEMVFIATSDAKGNCDCSPKFGESGFVEVINSKTLAYPEYRGNGVFASLGNMCENAHIGLLFVDFFETKKGLHINGKARSYPILEIPALYKEQIDRFSKHSENRIERWVVIEVDEVYIHCSKKIPQLFKRKNEFMETLS